MSLVSKGRTVASVAEELGISHVEVLKALRVPYETNATKRVPHNDGTTLVNPSPRGRIDDHLIEREARKSTRDPWD